MQRIALRTVSKMMLRNFLEDDGVIDLLDDYVNSSEGDLDSVVDALWTEVGTHAIPTDDHLRITVKKPNENVILNLLDLQNLVKLNPRLIQSYIGKINRLKYKSNKGSVIFGKAVSHNDFSDLKQIVRLDDYLRELYEDVRQHLEVKFSTIVDLYLEGVFASLGSRPFRATILLSESAKDMGLTYVAVALRESIYGDIFKHLWEKVFEVFLLPKPMLNRPSSRLKLLECLDLICEYVPEFMDMELSEKKEIINEWVLCNYERYQDASIEGFNIKTSLGFLRSEAAANTYLTEQGFDEEPEIVIKKGFFTGY